MYELNAACKNSGSVHYKFIALLHKDSKAIA